MQRASSKKTKTLMQTNIIGLRIKKIINIKRIRSKDLTDKAKELLIDNYKHCNDDDVNNLIIKNIAIKLL